MEKSHKKHKRGKRVMHTGRQYYLDNIRNVIISGLFIAHSCEAYHMKEAFLCGGNTVPSADADI